MTVPRSLPSSPAAPASQPVSGTGRGAAGAVRTLRRHLFERVGDLSPWAVDLLVATVVAVPTVLDAWWNEPGTRQADGLTYGLTAVSLVALLARRRRPVATALVCGAALTGWYVLGHHGELLNLPTMVALYTVAVSGDRRTTVVVAVVASTWSGVLGFTSDDPLGARGGSPVLEMVWPLVPLALGEAVRASRELVAQATREREHEARRRVDAERVRIARDVHDVVAHAMAAVHVQVGVAVAAFDRRPETARAALVQARAAAKDALAELRSSIDMLRDPDAAGPVTPSPSPGLGQVDWLAGAARAAGIEVEVHVEVPDGPGRLPGAVEVAAYRIVQEALTNVVRHSGARRAVVVVRAEPDALVVEVTDDGTGGPGPGAGRSHPAHRPAGPGHGLVGMAERARALGGRLRHGPGPRGGFRVHAVLPLAPQLAPVAEPGTAPGAGPSSLAGPGAESGPP